MTIPKNPASKGQIVVYAPYQDILDTQTAGELQVNYTYRTTDLTEVKSGRAVLGNKIEWDVKQTSVDAVASNLAAEVSRATAAEGTIASNLAAEVSRATAAEGTIASNLAAEVSRAQIAENAVHDEVLQEAGARADGDSAEALARANAISALQTAVTNAMNAAVAALRDTTVADIIPVAFTDSQALSLTTVLGANRPDGIYALPFTSDDVEKTATIDNGIAFGTVGHEEFAISFGDILRVKINGGAIESVTLVDDLDRQKFIALDASISALQAATTQAAIRGHFSATGWATLVNGLFEVAPSLAPDNDLATSLLDGKAFLDVDQTTSDAGGSAKTLQTHLVDLYADIAAINQNGAFGASNGVSKSGSDVVFGGALTTDTTITGAKKLAFRNSETFVKQLSQPIFDIASDGSLTESADTVSIWWSRSPSGNIEINYLFPNL